MTALFEAILFLYLLGYPLNWVRGKRETAMVDLALTFAQGLLLNYLILLLAHEIRLSLALGCIGAIIGLGFLIADCVRGRFPTRLRIGSIGPLAFVAAICLLKIFSEPLRDWDARSIWFFHAKMIYLAGTLGREAGWTNAVVASFAHPDYPELISSLGAELCTRCGVWNEYLPKGSLFIALIPGLFWIFSFFEWSLEFLALVLFLLLGMGAWLWNGYMDGFLGLFAGLFGLLLYRYRSEGRAEDLSSAILTLGLITSIKNEGMLFACCGLSVLVATEGLKRERAFWRRLLAIVCVAFSPAVIWSAARLYWGVTNDIGLASSGVLERVGSRFVNGFSVKFVLNSVFFLNHPVRDSFLVLCGCLVLLRFFRVSLPKEVARALRTQLFIFVLYSAGLFWVYMLTAHNQEAHVMSSIDRTTFISVCLLNAAIYLTATAAAKARAATRALV